MQQISHRYKKTDKKKKKLTTCQRQLEMCWATSAKQIKKKTNPTKHKRKSAKIKNENQIQSNKYIWQM